MSDDQDKLLVERYAPELMSASSVSCLSWVADDFILAEVVYPSAADQVDPGDVFVHLFPLRALAGWRPDEGGTDKIVRMLEDYRVKHSIPAGPDKSWCRVQWDSDGMPEIVHAILDQVVLATERWLSANRLEIGVHTFLNNLQRHLAPAGRTWLEQRLWLLRAFAQEPLSQILLEAQPTIKLQEGVPDPDFSVIQELPRTQPGSWCIQFLGLSDKLVSVDSFMEGLLASLRASFDNA